MPKQSIAHLCQGLLDVFTSHSFLFHVRTLFLTLS